MKHVMKNLYKYILLLALLGVGCTTDVIDRGWDNEEEEEEEEEVLDSYPVEWMDVILSEYYLYNDEYNTLDRDLTLSYSEFLSATLMSMETNVLDYKDDKIYSYVTRSISTKSETRISESKVYEITLGLAKAKLIQYTASSNYGIAVLGVYPNSPLYDAGIKRGDLIVSVNDTQLTSSNVSGWAQLLLQPSYSGVSYVLGLEDGSSVSVSSVLMMCNPILLTEIYEEGDKKIGYISYSSFDMAWDDDLMDVIVEFKAAGVTDLILDMRLNGGGYILSANKLSSAIGGAVTADKVFAYYTYNDTRMDALHDTYKSDNFMSDWSEYYLELDQIVCLVSGSTASASEMTINSLKGIGLEVTLIGDQTEGKNVGMEVFSMTYGGYDYEFYPISMVVSNAEGNSDYSEGFSVDCYVDDWDNGDAFSDYGKDEVMISTAINYIIDGEFAGTKSPSVQSRSGEDAVSKLSGEVLSASFIPRGGIYLQE